MNQNLSDRNLNELEKLRPDWQKGWMASSWELAWGLKSWRQEQRCRGIRRQLLRWQVERKRSEEIFGPAGQEKLKEFKGQCLLLGRAKEACYERHYLPVKINVPWFESLYRIQLHKELR